MDRIKCCPGRSLLDDSWEKNKKYFIKSNESLPIDMSTAVCIMTPHCGLLQLNSDLRWLLWGDSVSHHNCSIQITKYFSLHSFSERNCVDYPDSIVSPVSSESPVSGYRRWQMKPLTFSSDSVTTSRSSDNVIFWLNESMRFKNLREELKISPP